MNYGIFGSLSYNAYGPDDHDRNWCVNNYLYEVLWNKQLMQANSIESTMLASFNAITKIMKHELSQPLGAIKLESSFGKQAANSPHDSQQQYQGIFSRILLFHLDSYKSCYSLNN